MTKKKYGQRGMVLLEMVSALTITALLLGGAFALIFHEYNGTDLTKNTVTVANEVGNAARRISQDGMMAENTNLIDGAAPVNQLTLTWTEQYDFAYIPHSSSYSLSGTELRRNYDGIESILARDISKIEFSQTGQLLTVSICCTPHSLVSERTVQKTYRIYLRPTDEAQEW